MLNSILDILHHSLGRTAQGMPRYPHNPDFRNHFCTGPGSSDFDLCCQAVGKGLMADRGANAISGGDHVFVVTQAGKDYIRLKSLKQQFEDLGFILQFSGEMPKQPDDEPGAEFYALTHRRRTLMTNIFADLDEAENYLRALKNARKGSAAC